jgi:lauroyl/myristoyl acyltransferase
MPAEATDSSNRARREDRKKRSLPARLYVSFWKRLNIFGGPAIAVLRAAEKLFGPGCMPVFLLPVVWLDVVRRLVDYRAFKKVRTILPEEFWRGLGPLRHSFRMARNWDSLLTGAFFSDRLGETGWARRFQVRGTRPDQLPESAGRPIILVHLHIGAYALVHFWLRAQRLRATCYWAGEPLIFGTPWARRIFAEAARVHGMEDIPRIFLPHQLRAALQFLVPGHILTTAMDSDSTTCATFNANGHEILLSQGVVHLAEASHAILVPVSVISEGAARFEIRFGPPVPDALVDKHHPRPAIQYLLDHLWKDVEEDPSRLSWSTLLMMDRRSKPSHIPWP